MKAKTLFAEYVYLTRFSVKLIFIKSVKKSIKSALPVERDLTQTNRKMIFSSRECVESENMRYGLMQANWS